MQRVNNDIHVIECILSTFPFDANTVRRKILSVNTDHLDSESTAGDMYSSQYEKGGEETYGVNGV